MMSLDALKALANQGLDYGVFFIEVFAALIVLFAVAEAMAGILKRLVRTSKAGDDSYGETGRMRIRIVLGKWLAMALEFALAADILMTIISPTWNDIAKLAAIILLRTLLTFFLHTEVKRLLRRENEIGRALSAGDAKAMAD